ncbi:MAG: hypothetical protein AB7R69_04110 [Candidatus Babeliales bacterium]
MLKLMSLLLLFQLESPEITVKKANHDKVLEIYLDIAFKTAYERAVNYGLCASNLSHYIKDSQEIPSLKYNEKRSIIDSLQNESHQYPFAYIAGKFNLDHVKLSRLYDVITPYEMALNFYLYAAYTKGLFSREYNLLANIWHSNIHHKEMIFECFSDKEHKKIQARCKKIIKKDFRQPLYSVKPAPHKNPYWVHPHSPYIDHGINPHSSWANHSNIYKYQPF